MKYLLIVNPKSGDQTGVDHVRYVTDYFARKGDEITVAQTKYSGHAEKIAREASEYDVVIGAGGDGTINEVLNGLIGKKQKLGIIPRGTGNVFAREMNIPRDLKSACKIIRKGKSLRLDAGKSNTTYFLLMSGIGFDAYSLRQMTGSVIKKKLGMFAYAVGVFKAFSRYQYPEIEIILEDGKRDRGSFVLVSNTSRYGSFFSFSPKAVPVDGYLDVFVFRETGTLSTLKLFVRLMMESFGWLNPEKRMLFLKKIGTHRTTSVQVQSDFNILTQLDGELAGPLPVKIVIIPKAIEVLLPGKTIKKYQKKK